MASAERSTVGVEWNIERGLDSLYSFGSTALLSVCVIAHKLPQPVLFGQYADVEA